MRRNVTRLVGIILVLAGLFTHGNALQATAANSGPSGRHFVDPQGSYTLTLGKNWVRAQSPVADVEGWKVAPSVKGVSPNVNVLTQEPGIDLNSYLDLSVQEENTKVIDNFTLVDKKVVPGSAGMPLGRLEYTGQAFSRALHFLAVIGVKNGRAVVATLTTTPGQFARLRRRIEPFLLTLNPR